jgi:hypothetical protein
VRRSIRLEPPTEHTATQWDEDDFDLAVRSPGALLQELQQSQEPPATMEEKRPLRRQPEDHHFWSLIMLAVTAGGFLLVTWVATKVLFVFKSLQSLEGRLAKTRPCFERIS